MSIEAHSRTILLSFSVLKLFRLFQSLLFLFNYFSSCTLLFSVSLSNSGFSCPFSLQILKNSNLATVVSS